MKFFHKALFAVALLPFSITAAEKTVANIYSHRVSAQSPLLENSGDVNSPTNITYSSPTLSRANDYFEKAAVLYTAGKYADAEYLLLDNLKYLSSNGLQPYVFQDPSTRVEEDSFKIFGWTLFKSRRVIEIGGSNFSTTSSINGLYNQVIRDLAKGINPTDGIFDFSLESFRALRRTLQQLNTEDLLNEEAEIPAPPPVEILGNDFDESALRDAHRIELDILRLFQKTLIAQNDPTKTEKALEIAELIRNLESIRLLPAVAYALNQNIFDASSQDGAVPEFVVSESLSVDEIREIASAENSTLVHYSVVGEGEIIIWVVNPQGDIRYKTIQLSSDQPSLEALANTALRAAGSFVDRGEEDYVLVEALRDPKFTSSEPLRWGAVPDELKVTESDQFFALRSLYDLLIAPIENDLPQEPGSKVIFVPQNTLFSVPFSALISPSGDSLIDNHSVRISPNLQYLQRGANPLQKFPEKEQALVIGNPSHPNVSALPGAEREARAIATLTGGRPLLQEHANANAVLQEVRDAKVVHFAAHGRLDIQIDPKETMILLHEVEGKNTSVSQVVGGLPEASSAQPVSYSLWPDSSETGRWHVIRIVGALPGAIALSDAYLTSQNAINLSLDADLVVLSACNTNRGLTGESNLLGLPMALGIAGVPQVVASHWAVPDESTQILMSKFYEAMHEQRNNIDVAQALREAMLEVKSIEKYKDPIHWAGFTVIDVSK